MKSLNDLYKKYEGLIKLIILVVPLLFAAYKYLGTYIDMPERMDRFEARAKHDSSFVMPKIKKIDSVSTNEGQDYRLILEMQDSLRTLYEENKKIKQFLQIQ